MAEKKYDVIIIGAGPAGSSAARTLVAGGMDTLVIEKKKLPRQKICSGILCKWAVNFVNKNFGVIPENAYCQPNFLDGVALHFPSQTNPVIIPSIEPITYIWRAPFDHFLAVGCGAEVKDGLMMVHIEMEANEFKVHCKKFHNNGHATSVSFSSKYLVAADGFSSRSVRRVMPGTYEGLPRMKCLQVHYGGEINLSPSHFNVFIYPNVGVYAWANIKDDHIHVGSSIIGNRKLISYHNNFVSLLEKQYGLKIKKTIFKEGMAMTIAAPLNRFILGKDNFLVAGDTAGFIHSGGEAISCALTSGDFAGQAILMSEKNSQKAFHHYQSLIREEAELCLDQFNPLRIIKSAPIDMDIKSVWKKYSLKEHYKMWKDLKAYGTQDNGVSDTGVYKVSKKNMIYHFLHRKYPITL